MRTDATRAAATIAALLVLASSTPSAWAGAGNSDIPSYYTHLDFNLTSPSAWTTAAGGYANPAVYAAMPGAELEWYGGIVEDDGQSGLDRWGLFTGLKHLGLGAVHQRMPAANGTYAVTDYRLALSFGDQSSALGVSLGWSRGDREAFARHTVMQLGTVQRFGAYVSAGLAGTFSTETADQSGLADLAVRPLGTDRLSVFGDIELPRGAALEDAPWSAGAMVQVVPGVSFIGRYFEDESFALSFAYSFGGDIAGGYVRDAITPRFDKEGDHASTNYGIRVGFPERNAFAERFFRDRYYASMNLKGNLVHTRYRFFDPSHTLYDVLDQLERARTDDRIAGVAVSLSGARMSAGNAWEVREKLKEVRAAGKHVVVFIDEASMTLYHVASVADRIVMDPEGTLVLPGYTLGRTYIRSMLDKMGLGIEEWRLFEYKSAMESLTRHGMSEADREQRQALADQYYRTMTGDVAGSREVSQDTVDSWIDDATVFTADQAMDEGLIDVLGRWEDVKDVVESLEGDRKGFVAAKWAGGGERPSRRWGHTPQVAVVYALGACAMDSGINARRLEKTFHRLRDDRNVKAVVLRVNSPGGSGMASDVVAAALKECAEKKPVIVSQGDVAASGGYWISMYGTEILVQPTTITGSIGVIGGWIWDDGLGEKLGMEGDFVKAGEHADVFYALRFPFVGLPLPYRDLTEEEHERVYASMRHMYNRFVGHVADGRGLSTDEVKTIAQGRVWTGVQGVDNGLADRIGGLQAAIDRAREKAGYGRGDDIAVVQYGEKGLFDLERVNPLPMSWLLRAWARGGDGAGSDDFMDDYNTTYLRELARHNGRAMCLVPPEYMPAPDPR